MAVIQRTNALLIVLIVCLIGLTQEKFYKKSRTQDIILFLVAVPGAKRLAFWIWR